MGGGGGNSGGGGGGGNWQQAKITPEPKQEEVTQKTKSTANVPTEGISGPGGPVQNDEQKPNDFKPEQPDKRDPCLVKVFDTLLAHPVPSALKSTSVGTVLTVKSRGDRLDALNDSHEICGFITAKMKLLIGCDANGHKFLARIIAMNGGEVRVRVYNELDAA